MLQYPIWFEIKMQHETDSPKNVNHFLCLIFSFPLFFYEENIQSPATEHEGGKSSSVLSF